MSAKREHFATTSRVWGLNFALVVFVMVCFGLVMAYSASYTESINLGISPIAGMKMQLFSAVVGTVVALLLWRFMRMSWLSGNLAYGLWAVGMAFMVATMAFGTVSYGCRRWLDLGFLEFQPSEPMKIVLIIMAAKLFAEYHEGVWNRREFIGRSLIFIGIPLLIMLIPDPGQSDMGTTMIAAVGIFAVLILGGFKMRWVLLLGIPAVVAAVAGITLVGYRSARITAWLDPFSTIDLEGGGYQLVHSYYALANGGVFGVGLGNSHEKFQYLPMADNDMIFAVIGEELGLIGCVAVIALFLVFLVLGLRIAYSCRDEFVKMVSGAVVLMVVFEAFLNICCSTGILPITGKPLPFFSMGGTVLLVLLSSMGLVLAAARDGGEDPSASRRDGLRLATAAPAFEDEARNSRTLGKTTSSGRSRRL